MGKFGWTASVGAMLGVIAMIGSLMKGDPFTKSVGMIPGGIILSMIVVYGFTQWLNENSGRGATIDPQVFKLQNELRSTLQAAASFDASGDYLKAGHMRSHAAVLESQLRSLGA